jgi:hypothetical protein
MGGTGLTVFNCDMIIAEEAAPVIEFHTRYRKRLRKTGWYIYTWISRHLSGLPYVHVILHEKKWGMAHGRFDWEEDLGQLSIIDEALDIKLRQLGI